MVTDKWIVLNRPQPMSFHVRDWRRADSSADPSFILLHGLASNAQTWDGVATRLMSHGYAAIAVDQRGHGRSDKPDNGYDFDTVAADLMALLDALAIERPIVIGQSWGGNVVLAFGAAYPGRARGLGFVDGGYLDLQMRPNSDWDSVARDLKPPALAGIQATELAVRMRQAHQNWAEAGIDGTMANFEVLPDGTVHPWLSLDRHMLILRALWEQRPDTLYPRVQAPVYIAVAEDARNPDWMAIKGQQVAAAERGLASVRVERYPATDHDIHVHRPQQLARALMAELVDGIWSDSHKP